jgi:cell division initiation protein
MAITPLDIRKQPFRKAFRGFDPDEVNSFLEMVAGEFESVIKKNSELTHKLQNTQEQLEEYKKIEKTLNDTLLTAQKATDESKVNAQKEAELIIKDAQVRANSYEEQSRQNVRALQEELSRLTYQRDSFMLRFKSILETQLELLRSIEGELDQPLQQQEEHDSGTRPGMSDTAGE